MTRIKKRRIHTDLLLLTAFLCLLAGCSTTKNLPEGETLYVGVKNINVINEDKTPAGVTPCVFPFHSVYGYIMTL